MLEICKVVPQLLRLYQVSHVEDFVSVSNIDVCISCPSSGQTRSGQFEEDGLCGKTASKYASEGGARRMNPECEDGRYSGEVKHPCTAGLRLWSYNVTNIEDGG